MGGSMRLRNKKTGEIGELHYEPDKEYHFTVATEDPADIMIFKTLAELNAEWEDAPKEPKEYWFIDYDGGIIPFDRRKETARKKHKEQGRWGWGQSWEEGPLLGREGRQLQTKE